jgi:hypothetical protein
MTDCKLGLRVHPAIVVNGWPFVDRNMSTGLEAARRRFPASIGQIEILIRQDEDFSELCNDLAAAEAALVAVEDLAPTLREGRVAECNDWIASLSNEIEVALQNAKIIPITKRPCS